LPIADASADLVLSTQVLEHVESPEAYLAECLRVLKPKGYLLLTTHGVFRYHPGPHDFWRWTHTGLSRLLHTSGFEVASLEGVIAGPAAALQMFQDLTMHRLPSRLRPLYIGVLQSLMGMLDRRMSDQARLDNAWDYAVLARPHSRGKSA
jgi:SAM-dependent methyltransferase